MTARLVCAACETAVLPEVEVLDGWCFGYTDDGNHAHWESLHFGVVHECDPEDRALVFMRDGLRLANPPWLRWLWRHAWTRPLASRLQVDSEFKCAVRIEPAA